MAKRRRVSAARASDRVAAADHPVSAAAEPNSVDALSIATGLLAAAIVYVSYYPSDSVAVERGDALWLGMLALVIATLSLAHRWWFGGDRVPSTDGTSTPSRFAIGVLSVGPWLLALWMIVSAFVNAPPGNLRMATNEAWLWVSAAAFFNATRIIAVSLDVRSSLLVVLVVCASGMSVHGLHQYLISHPAQQAAYEKDPDRVLALAGIDAPPGSAERMIFANRLYDGGPSATFALANSLAAFLVVGVVLAAGILRFQWSDFSAVQRLAWGAAALLCAGCLIAARSRSAVLAMLIGLVLVLIKSSRLGRSSPRGLALGLATVLLLAILGTLVIAVAGNREWFEQAPASLAFRFQYWRSTWQMVLDRPLLGAGPGNFQSMYERYREASATEQIAEPHNLFFETLASGGMLGLVTLLAILGAAVWIVVAGRGRSDADTDPSMRRRQWVWLGAVLSLAMIWLIAWASRRTPDPQASLFVIPIAGMIGVILASSADKPGRQSVDAVCVVALLAAGIHLMVAGGWTVPGVAIAIWICAGMLTRLAPIDPAAARRRDQRTRLVGTISIAVVGAFATWVLYAMSLRPVENQARLMAVIEGAQSTGQAGTARAALQQVGDADPWSPDGILWLADSLRWTLVRQGDTSQDRRRWSQCLETARQRGGDDPAIYRMIGAQQIHLYQRFGNPADLNAAAKSFDQALRWSPSNQWIAAQMAAIAQSQGDHERAQRLSQQSRKLSKLGGNIERQLQRQLIYVAEPLGSAANQGPVRRPASELLPEPNPL